MLLRENERKCELNSVGGTASRGYEDNSKLKLTRFITE